MDNAWRLRFIFLTVLAIMFAVDIFVHGVKTDTSQQEGEFQQEKAELGRIGEDNNIDGISVAAFKKRRKQLRMQTDTIKESCMPKMLCEMASKSDYMLSDNEKELLHLIRSSALTFSTNGLVSKWHFASHMGELLRFTGDNLSSSMGCSQLWPSCPISSKQLTKLSFHLKI